jgi:hypothetical protein
VLTGSKVLSVIDHTLLITGAGRRDYRFMRQGYGKSHGTTDGPKDKRPNYLDIFQAKETLFAI